MAVCVEPGPRSADEWSVCSGHWQAEWNVERRSAFFPGEKFRKDLFSTSVLQNPSNKCDTLFTSIHQIHYVIELARIFMNFLLSGYFVLPASPWVLPYLPCVASCSRQSKLLSQCDLSRQGVVTRHSARTLLDDSHQLCFTQYVGLWSWHLG